VRFVVMLASSADKVKGRGGNQHNGRNGKGAKDAAVSRQESGKGNPGKEESGGRGHGVGCSFFIHPVLRPVHENPASFM
jgi:hypothetical protein